MTLTAAQVRQACALLHWSSPKLSRAARVPYEVARKARTDEGMLTLPSMDGGIDAKGQPNVVLAGAVIPGAPDRIILRWLARHAEGTATAIRTASGMPLEEVRAHLASLEGQGLAASRSDEGTNPPHRIFRATAEGHRAIGASDARLTM